jgi:methenyltetrahydromethanopterin cyclohydrolase
MSKNAKLSQPLAAPESLNSRSALVADLLAFNASLSRIAVSELPGGARFLDCGIGAPGGISAGLALARMCMGDLADLAIVPSVIPGIDRPAVQVSTDFPVLACLASQYAGWALSEGKFFAMGSGPMRAAAAKEDLVKTLGYAEKPDRVVGVLECRKVPPKEMTAKIARDCGIDENRLILAAAPTASLAGGVQVVARSVETALHKLAELGFDLSRIVAGQGWAPLPPVAKNDMAAIGRTNDAVLYGATVILQVTGDDESLADVGPKVPSSASSDFGEPFAAIFERYGYDFYKVDPSLFAPAKVIFENVSTGRSHTFGDWRPDVLKASFGLGS